MTALPAEFLERSYGMARLRSLQTLSTINLCSPVATSWTLARAGAAFRLFCFVQANISSGGWLKTLGMYLPLGVDL
jgi:hypothetical protein